MKNRLFLALAAAAAMTAAVGTACTIMAAQTENEAVETAEQTDGGQAGDTTVSCETFSVTIPGEIAEISHTKVTENSINFYEPVSQEKFGGFVGSIQVFADVKDYCNIPHFRRGGEIRYEDGTKLDIVIEYPSDVQFDFNSEESSENFKKISAAFEEIIAPSITAKEGKFVPQSEVDNTSVYDEVLKKLYKDLEEKKDQAGLEEDGFSYMYAMTYTEETDPLDDFGYTFIDLTGTGYPALAILRNDETPIVYDLFSQEDGNVKHIFSSAERDYFTLSGYEGTDFAAIHEHASGGADLTEDNMFVLDPLKNELNQQVSFLYDGRENAENPFAVSYYPFDTPENLTQEEWIQRMENFGQDRLFTLTAIASVEP